MCSQRKGYNKNLRNSGETIVLSRDVEKYIVLWLNSMRRGGCPVSAQMLQIKALEVASERGFPRAFSPLHIRGGRASCGGIDCLFVFTTPEDAEAAAAKFRAEVCEMIVEYISTVLNADQTGELSRN
ncbi:Hypothetical protein PHPALM_20083 [Phytophthora palmivora]|uniref:HTH CENPB-type domain-containing protein n=1 Tax=Phytophthora palmivora TaxID=4796 RepID=A0A2P4XFR7_9STRA|nr:Hypothetical protein PHPALM_20083 [Phytophthora palmivora]